MTRAELARLLGGASAHGGQQIMIAESDPRKFMASFAQAVGGSGEIFLCSPDWGAFEHRQLDALVKQRPETGDLRPEIGDLLERGRPRPRDGDRGEVAAAPEKSLSSPSGLRSQVSGFPNRPPSAAGGWLMIPTGGTSGGLRFARHDSATIAAAVRGFTRHFGLPQVNAVGVLPLHHVSGLMAWMRCVLTGGQYLPLDWKAIEGGARPVLPAKAAGWTISLVPTQLERLLRNCRAGSPNPAALTAGRAEPRRDMEIPPYNESAVAWLKQFRVIFLGGAPAWPALLDRARELGLPLALSYGMTETAAMIAAQRPEEFLAGLRGCGAVLPHAQLAFDDEGSILVGGESVFRGYYPAWREAGEFATQDGGWLDERGHLHVSGRRDAVIITGGEKVNPAEVEAVLRGTGAFADVVVFGLPDQDWGESVVAAYPAEAPVSLSAVESALARLLSPAKRPKRFVAIKDWPVNAQGKVNRARVAELCARL